MLADFDFEKLLESYHDGGTEDRPVRRTYGTIIDYLVNKKGYGKEIVGAAILTIFLQIYSGKAFEGDGSYGSKGRELVTAIRIECDRLNQQKMSADMFEWMAQNVFQYIANQAAREAVAARKPWYKRLLRK